MNEQLKFLYAEYFSKLKENNFPKNTSAPLNVYF